MTLEEILIYDIETLKEFFLVGIYIPSQDRYVDFQVNKNVNQMDGLMKFIHENKDKYWVGYNNLRFDSQVMEWVIRHNGEWHELSSLEICNKIGIKASDVIDDANFETFAEYREEWLSFKQIDLFKLNHYDNKNRRVSLKRLEFEMDLENIEEMPIHHNKTGLTDEDIEMIRDYCRNDVMSTYEFYKITIGDTTHPVYKGNNQIELRENIEQEFGIKCLNFSDSKIGDEMIKKYYCEEKGIQYKDLPRKGFFRKEILIKNCIADYISFEHPQLKDFLSTLKKKKLTLQDDLYESVSFYGNTYTFAKGGLHTENKPQIFEATEDVIIVDLDVSSYYPAIIINNNKYPFHLGKEFLSGYKRMFEKRLELKPQAKKDKRIKGIVNALKLSVNSVYGKSSDMQSWIYDRQLTMFTTITGELSLFMLIEMLEKEDIHIIMANTDGITIMFNKSLEKRMKEICDKWCKLTNFELERADYKKMIVSTVNDYIAVKTDGEVKLKGDFLIDFDLHKNKSKRIVPIALQEYFVNNIPVEQTIRNHKNIYDFCIRQKSTKDFHYEGVNRKTGEKNVYNKLIRYYVSNTGEKLFKIKNEGSDSGAANSSQVEAGEWLCTVCNYLPKNSPLDNINYSYYIEEADKIINKVKGGNNKTKVNPLQISLF